MARKTSSTGLARNGASTSGKAVDDGKSTLRAGDYVVVELGGA